MLSALCNKATITYHTAEVDGLKLFYREAGPQHAPTIVLLHGYPSSSRMWDSLIPLLADRYHIIAPDYPGFGQSEAPSVDKYDYTFDNIAKTIKYFLEEMGISRYTLFMQDYGGPVGFRIAMAAPENVQAIIIQNANAYEDGLGAKWTHISKFWADPTAHSEQVDAFTGFEGTQQRHLGTSPNLERYNPDTWLDEFAFLSRPEQREIQTALFYDYRNNIAAYPLWQTWLREYQPQMLILWGRYDPSFIVPGAEAYKRDVPNAELHILDAGHFALDEKNEEVAYLTRNFMQRL